MNDSLSLFPRDFKQSDLDGCRLMAQRVGDQTMVGTSVDSADALTMVEISPASEVLDQEWLEDLTDQHHSPDIGVDAFLADQLDADIAIFAFARSDGSGRRIQVDPMIESGSIWALMSDDKLLGIEVRGAARVLARFIYR